MNSSNQYDKPSESVVVDIYDQQYHLRGNENDHVLHLAQLVDAKMRAVAHQCTTADSLRVAVLAALNIADELVQTRQQMDAIVKNHSPEALRARADSLSTLLDEVLISRPIG